MTLEVIALADADRPGEALRLHGGRCLPGSASPFADALRATIETRTTGRTMSFNRGRAALEQSAGPVGAACTERSVSRADDGSSRSVRMSRGASASAPGVSGRPGVHHGLGLTNVGPYRI